MRVGDWGCVLVWFQMIFYQFRNPLGATNVTSSSFAIDDGDIVPATKIGRLASITITVGPGVPVMLRYVWLRRTSSVLGFRCSAFF